MKNILEFIENSALKYPDKLAVADEEGGLTYGQMERLSRQIGAWIYEKTDGVRNKPVAVLLDKKPGSVISPHENCSRQRLFIFVFTSSDSFNPSCKQSTSEKSQSK